VILLLLGAPGSGKGTQGRRLSAHFKVPYMASGDLLRRAIDQRTPLGEQVRHYVERGLYVPDDVMVPAAMKELEHLRQEWGTAGVVLDGFPRTREQAISLDEALATRGMAIDRAIYLYVPKDVLIARLASRWTCRCGRSYNLQTHQPKVDKLCDVDGLPLFQRVDDSAETADRRLTVYVESTGLLIEHYRQNGRLVEVDGNRPENEVTAALIAAAETGAPNGVAGTAAYDRAAVRTS
jgi:adenylate kinase